MKQQKWVTIEPKAAILLLAFRLISQIKKGMMVMEAYCVKCKEKREVKNPAAVTMKNGRPATSGTCPVCGTKIFRIGATAAK
jgi:Domain of unknown function (DUF5679)